LGDGTICQPVPSQRSATVVEVNTLNAGVNSALPTAMHELADEQSTPLRFVKSAPATFGVGGTVQAADATEGVSSSAAIANKTSRNDRSDICPTEATPLVSTGQAPPVPSRALDVSWRIAEDGHPLTPRRCEDPLERRFGREAAIRFAWKAAV
jgi:hypothetical protein